MNHPKSTRTFSFSGAALGVMLLLPGSGISAEPQGRKSPTPAAATGRALDACSFIRDGSDTPKLASACGCRSGFMPRGLKNRGVKPLLQFAFNASGLAPRILTPKSELEKSVGWELRDGKPKDASPGLSRCYFTMPPMAYQTRRYDNPPLPKAAGFSSLVITTFPTTEETFEQSRRTMGTTGGDIPRMGQGAFLNGPAMIYVRVRSYGFSIRLYVDEPKTDAGRARLREVLLNLAGQGIAAADNWQQQQPAGR